MRHGAHVVGRRRHWLQAGLAVALVLLVAGCQRTPSEDQLRAQVEDLREAVIARNASQVAEHLSEDFIGPEGMDRRDARRLATAMFLRYQQLGVRTGPLSVQMQDERRATVSFTAMTTGGSGGLMPERGQVHEVTTGWRVEGGQWKLVSAQWKPAL